MSNLPKHGVSLVVENVQKSLLDLDKFNERVDQSARSVERAAKKVTPFNKALSNLGSEVQSTGQRVISAIPGGNALVGVLEAIPGPALAAAAGLAAGAAAAVAAGAAFVALGNRGAPLVGLAESFDNLSASVGVSSKTLLEDLRKASAGTVSDFDLIRRANLALVGSTGEFGKAFGQQLPKILESARAAARATGQDVDFLFQSLVTGIKRGSPLLIDNTGIVLKIGEANQALADSLGKTVEQLSEEEKQMAILNATVEAGQQLIDSLGASQETAAEKGARASATLTNIFDTVSIAIQPAYSALLDVINDVLGGIQGFVQKAAPYINIVAQAFGQVIKFVGGLIKDFGKGMLQGGYNTLKAFGEGAAFAVNKVIFPVIIGLAKGIADFLVGQSPPPKGPLSNIDKGGQNVMAAWLDGFTGVSLQPIETVAAEVSAALGSIGKSSLSQVELRLVQLDKALLPFQQRLDIVKSRFDAIAAPAQAALEAIDRQQAEAEAALASGDQSAAERIRLLDTQRAEIQKNLDVQQAFVDTAQVQLALAQAQQAEERALLNIRKTQLQVTQKVASAADKATKAPKEEKAKKGEAAPETAPVAGASTGFQLPDQSVLDNFQFDAEGARNAFDSLFGADAIPDFTENQAALEAQLNRLKTVDPTAGLAGRFKGITDIFDPAIEGSVANVVSNFFSPDPGTPGSFASFINSLTTIDLTAVGAAVGTAVADVFSFFTSDDEDSLKGKIAILTGDGEGSIAYFFANMPQRITDALAGLLDKLKTDIFDPISEFLSGTEPGTFGGVINDVVTFFTDLPERITAALSSLGATLHAGIVVPVVSVLNGMIGAVETGLKNLLQNALDFAGGFVGALGVFAPPELSEAINTLKSSVGNFSIPRIAVPAIEEAATGGMFTKGLVKVGEEGPEYVGAASRIGILPAQITRALDGLGSILAAPAPVMVPAGNTSYQDSHNSSLTANFYGQQDAAGVMRRMSVMRARGR